MGAWKNSNQKPNFAQLHSRTIRVGMSKSSFTARLPCNLADSRRKMRLRIGSNIIPHIGSTRTMGETHGRYSHWQERRTRRDRIIGRLWSTRCSTTFREADEGDYCFREAEASPRINCMTDKVLPHRRLTARITGCAHGKMPDDDITIFIETADEELSLIVPKKDAYCIYGVLTLSRTECDKTAPSTGHSTRPHFPEYLNATS